MSRENSKKTERKDSAKTPSLKGVAADKVKQTVKKNADSRKK
jgi:hypothetical protein